MNKQKYIALTIGPIIKTLSMARKTRELWGASYMFSYLMRETLRTLKKEHVLIPFYEDLSSKSSQNYGAGLYSDRIILKTNDFGVNDLRLAFEKQLKVLAFDIGLRLDESNETIENFLKNFLKYYAIEIELSETDIVAINGKDNKSPILAINKYLDTCELQENYVSQETCNYLSEYFNIINFKSKGDFSILIKDAFDGKKVFPSIIEIATKELSTKRNYNDKVQETQVEEENSFEQKKALKNDHENTLMAKIKELAGEDFRSRHKYICILQADGDSIGKVISEIGNDEDQITAFSKCLYDFAKKAAQLVFEYGGQPVYIGGDDILAFAPVYNNGKNIFDLITVLDQEFFAKFKDYEVQPSLSYGISISYYKFPMAEALSEARNLLFRKAKEYKFLAKDAEGKNIQKNAVAFRVLKHSGQYFGCTLRKDSKSYTEFKKMILSQFEKDSFLNSVPHKILSNEVLIKAIGNDPVKVENFVNNNFNERIHKDENLPYKKFLDSLKNFIPMVFAEYKEKQKDDCEKEPDNRIEVLYSTLRMVKFLNQKDNE